MTMSLRREMKDKRRKQRQKQRQLALLAILGGVVLVVALLVVPGLLKSSAPVGDFTIITPVARPQASGTAAGDPNAPVRIDAFEDFQCPACKYYAENVEPEIMKTYVATGKVYYVFRNYPFLDDNSATRESDQSANAAMCAADQGRFWDYHDILFTNWKGENIGYLTDKRLTAFAQALGLDMNAFNACFKANKHKDQINTDLADGAKMGMSGTPSIFVNGKIIAPGKIPTFEDIKAAVNAALGQ